MFIIAAIYWILNSFLCLLTPISVGGVTLDTDVPGHSNTLLGCGESGTWSHFLVSPQRRCLESA